MMIVVSFLIMLYIKFSKPFRHDFNNYFAAVGQLFLTLFYSECLLLKVFADEDYSDFRKILGLSLSIMISFYMMVQVIAVMIIYFKKCKRRQRRSKHSLSQLIKENGLAM